MAAPRGVADRGPGSAAASHSACGFRAGTAGSRWRRRPIVRAGHARCTSGRRSDGEGVSMTITDPLVLSPDVLVFRVADLPAAVREEIGDTGAFALTRARARATSSLVDEAVAELLQEFRSPSTIVEAVIRYCRRRGLDPERTLTESYPTLRRCLMEGYLVAAGS